MFLLALFANSLFAQEFLRAPAQLKATYTIEDPTVSLTWWEPNTPFWMHYDNGGFAGGVGFDAPGEFDVAIAYVPDDLQPYNGMAITKFSFAPAELDAIYVFKIWIGNTADSVVYQDTLSDLTLNAWNTIVLDSAVVLDASQLYLFGYHVNAQGGFPAGIDEGPVSKPGYSDLIRIDETFYSLYDMGIDANVCMQVYLEEPVAGIKSTVFVKDVNTNQGLSFSMLTQKQNKEVLSLSHFVKAPILESYNIYRNSELIGTSTINSYTDQVSESNIYYYSASAVYDAGESERSDSVRTLYDNNRIAINKLVSETFINVGTYIGENGSTYMNSPSSPGPFMGIFELDFEVENLAPIIYHSGTGILGDDPYSNTYGEIRMNEYLMRTFAFPLTAFNGTSFFGGGGSETLYEPYKAFYDAELTRKTPIDLQCTIQKVTSSKYLLNATMEMVGVYEYPENLTLKVVLTQLELDYVWASAKFDKVRFVETDMFPDYTGTGIDFSGATTVTNQIEVSVDPFLPVSNYRLVAFIEDTVTHQIWNGDYVELPYSKNVTFTVLDQQQMPIVGAIINVNQVNKTTDALGSAAFILQSNLGEVNYTVNKTNYFEYQGSFNIDTADTIAIQLITTGIEQESENSFSVYPNPARDILNIQSQSSAHINLYSFSGQEIMSKSFAGGTIPVDLSSLENGVYFVLIQDSQHTQTYRIVKQ
jgi:hypothetical protein